MFHVLIKGFALSAFFAGMTAQASPLITSSEDTLARNCLARNASYDRLVMTCRAALAEPGLTSSTRVDLMTTLGEIYLDAYELNDAKEQFKSALALAPDAVASLQGLGWTEWSEDNNAAAREHFERAMTIQPSAENLAGFSDTSHGLGLISAEEALDLFDAALAIDPVYAWGIRAKGWLQHDIGENDAAKLSFERALAIDPTDPNAHVGMSYALSDLQDYEKSLTHINRAIQEEPESAWHYQQRSFVLRQLDRNAQAAREADRFIELMPNSEVGYIAKARALDALVKREEALNVLRDMPNIAPRNANYAYWFAELLVRDDRIEEAMTAISKGVLREDATSRTHDMHAYVALELDNFPVALTAAKASIQDAPNEPFGYYYHAMALANTKAYDESKEQFALAIDRGLSTDYVGYFASELIANGRLGDAIAIRVKY